MISQENIDNIMGATDKQIKTFSFTGEEGYCQVSNVYDADTCRIIFYLKSELIRVTVRLDEIDAPEIKPSKNQTPLEIQNEINAAIFARDRVRELTSNKLMFMKLGKNDKYKRPLCNLYTCDSNYKVCDRIQDILLNEKLVVKYTGGKKLLYKDWDCK